MRHSLSTSVVLLLCAGCALLSRPVEEPEIEVQSVGIGEASFSGIEVLLALDIYNPNEFGMPLEGGSFQISIGGARAATGEFDLSETIPARASAPLETSLRIGTADAARVSRRLARGDRSYELAGTLSFATRAGRLEVGYAHEGYLEDIGRALR